jgi:hypothetical protein
VQALVAELAQRHQAAVRELNVVDEAVSFPLPAVLAP